MQFGEMSYSFNTLHVFIKIGYMPTPKEDIFIYNPKYHTP